MDFDVSEKMQTMLEMVRSFMAAEVIPLEGEMLHGEQATLDAAVARAQDKVRQMGLVGPEPSRRVRRPGSDMVEHGLLSEALGRSPLGHLVFGVQAPMPATSRSCTARHRRAARALPAPARGRQDPQLLLDDRTRDAGLQPGDDGHHRRQRRRATT